MKIEEFSQRFRTMLGRSPSFLFLQLLIIGVAHQDAIAAGPEHSHEQ